MDMSLEKWISELEKDDYDFIDNCWTNFSGFGSADDFVELLTAPGETLQHSSSSESPTSLSDLNLWSDCETTTTTTTAAFERPAKQIKTVHNPSCALGGSPPSSPSTNPQRMLENVKNTQLEPDGEVVSNSPKGPSDESKNDGLKSRQKRSNPMTRTPSEAHDRVMAERKRREKLSERFIALSAIIPGLTKMDKATILGDAIKHLKQLQERAKSLEEQLNKKSEDSSVVLVEKSDHDQDMTSCSNEINSDDHPAKEAIPEIEARISDKNVLIRIHCDKKQKGTAVKLLDEVEKLHLSVVNSNFLLFGQCAMDITVIAQMEDDFGMKVKDLRRDLRSAFFKFMGQD